MHSYKLIVGYGAVHVCTSLFFCFFSACGSNFVTAIDNVYTCLKSEKCIVAEVHHRVTGGNRPQMRVVVFQNALVT